MLDDRLEELYELLELYFHNYQINEGLIKPSGNCTDAQPQLDMVIFREEILKHISQLLHSL